LRKRIIILAWVLFATSLAAQNLVLNPSFEMLDSCISNCQNQSIYGTQYLQFWDSPTLNDTPDVMAICNNPPLGSPYNCFFTSAPLNWQGYQYARTGENYMGYY
jgi:hypothetical protein